MTANAARPSGRPARIDSSGKPGKPGRNCCVPLLPVTVVVISEVTVVGCVAVLVETAVIELVVV